MSSRAPFLSLAFFAAACVGDVSGLPGQPPSHFEAAAPGPATATGLPAHPGDDAGTPPPPPPDAGPSLTDDAAIVADTFPANLNCNQTVTATVTVRNTGTSTWTKALGYYLGAVDDSDPLSPSTRSALDDGEAVPPGGERTFTVTLVAPNAAGSATTDWQVLRDQVHWFGAIFSKTVAVGCATTQPPFDLGQVVIQSSPDVRGFAVTSAITSLEFSPGDIHVDHTKRGQWPAVVIDPTDGTTQEATIWVFFCINGTWYGTGGERLRPNQTDKQLTNPSSIGPGWLYDPNRWGPMTNYVPQPGELVGFMVVAGSTRSDNNVAVQERTGVVLIPFPDDNVSTSFPPFFWTE